MTPTTKNPAAPIYQGIKATQSEMYNLKWQLPYRRKCPCHSTYAGDQRIGGRILQPVASNILLLRHAVRVDYSGRLESILTQAEEGPKKEVVRRLISKQDNRGRASISSSTDSTEFPSVPTGNNQRKDCSPLIRLAHNCQKPQLTGHCASRRCSSTWLKKYWYS